MFVQNSNKDPGLSSLFLTTKSPTQAIVFYYCYTRLFFNRRNISNRWFLSEQHEGSVGGTVAACFSHWIVFSSLTSVIEELTGSPCVQIFFFTVNYYIPERCCSYIMLNWPGKILLMINSYGTKRSLRHPLHILPAGLINHQMYYYFTYKIT